MVRIDPRWLCETHHDDYFSNGLDGWSAFKTFGPARHYWRDRVHGAVILDHPVVEELAVFDLRIRADGRFGVGSGVEPGRWHTMDLTWDLAQDQCAVSVDGEQTVVLRRLKADSAAASYLRLRSTAEKIDPSWFLVDSVRVDIVR